VKKTRTNGKTIIMATKQLDVEDVISKLNIDEKAELLSGTSCSLSEHKEKLTRTQVSTSGTQLQSPVSESHQSACQMDQTASAEPNSSTASQQPASPAARV
jgi:hypothetical protein